MKISTVLIIAGVGLLAWYLYKQSRTAANSVIYVEAQPETLQEAVNTGINNVGVSVVNTAAYAAENFLSNIFGTNGSNE